MKMGFWGAARRVFDLSLGEMLWSRRTIFMALIVGGPVLLALIIRGLARSGLAWDVVRVSPERQAAKLAA